VSLRRKVGGGSGERVDLVMWVWVWVWWGYVPAGHARETSSHRQLAYPIGSRGLQRRRGGKGGIRPLSSLGLGLGRECCRVVSVRVGREGSVVPKGASMVLRAQRSSTRRRSTLAKKKGETRGIERREGRESMSGMCSKQTAPIGVALCENSPSLLCFQDKSNFPTRTL
jgi:hypothetical protein